MSVTISDVKIEPFPVRRGGWARGECKATSDEGNIVEVVVIDPLGTRYWAERRGDLFVLEGEIPYSIPAGKYILYLVARDDKGGEARMNVELEVV